MSESEKSKYGFFGHMHAEFPSQIVVDVTERCNLACLHCPHEAFTQSPGYSGCDLEPGLNKKLVDEVREHGLDHVLQIRYTAAGEPLLHPQITDLLSYAVQEAGVMITLTTNGTLLDPDMVDAILATGVHMVDISIDAFRPETYARIRVNAELQKTRANVLDLLRKSKQGEIMTKVVVSFVEQDFNRGETDDFERFWKEQGAHYVVVRRQHSCAGAMTQMAEAMKGRDGVLQRRPCPYPWERIVLNPSGQLCFCPADWTHGASFIDFAQTSIVDAWKGDLLNGLRKAHLKNDFADHPLCRDCPDWQATRWPHEGRSYSDMIQEFQNEQAKGSGT